MYSEITLIIPAKNESESLPKVLNELKKYNVNKNVILERKDILTLNTIIFALKLVNKLNHNLIWIQNQMGEF